MIRTSVMKELRDSNSFIVYNHELEFWFKCSNIQICYLNSFNNMVDHSECKKFDFLSHVLKNVFDRPGRFDCACCSSPILFFPIFVVAIFSCHPRETSSYNFSFWKSHNFQFESFYLNYLTLLVTITEI